jgi:peptidoglycan/xylan/chitin deacetylase (PgdA/CDA1 family)
MHDAYPTSVEAALKIVDRLTDQGYTFVTVDKLINSV